MHQEPPGEVPQASRSISATGLTVTNSYGTRYVELDNGPVSLSLKTRQSLAKVARVSPAGTGLHRPLIGSDADTFADLDGFVRHAPTR